MWYVCTTAKIYVMIFMMWWVCLCQVSEYLTFWRNSHGSSNQLRIPISRGESEPTIFRTITMQERFDLSVGYWRDSADGLIRKWQKDANSIKTASKQHQKAKVFVSGPRSVDASQDNQKRKRASLVEESPSDTMDLEEQSQGLRTNLSHSVMDNWTMDTPWIHHWN